MPETSLNAATVGSKLSRDQEHLLALQTMQTLETYYQWSYNTFKPYIGRRIFDAGCGLGSFTAIAKDKAEYILAVDSSAKSIEMLKDRFKGSAIVEISQIDLESDSEFLRSKFLDTIVCLDVLEHVQNDVALLKSFFKIVQTGAHLLVKVPACKWLFGSIDTASGHYRRYTVKELRLKAECAGWETIKAGYMNVGGIFPYWVKSRVLRRELNFSRTFKPWQLQLIRRMVPILNILDQITGPPIGQSAILIGRKTIKRDTD